MGGWVGEQSSLPGLHYPPLILQEERSAIARARHFLESSAPLATDPYSSALTTYALTLLRSPAAPAALRKLRSLAITQGRAPHRHPGGHCGAGPRRTQEAAHGHMLGSKEAHFAHSVQFVTCHISLVAPFDEMT